MDQDALRDTVQAGQFERHRPQLQAVAYRMLGSVSEAEDAVQEAWLRLNRSDDAAILNLGGWLTTVVGRVCIDMLRARQSRREDLTGTWLPEPIVTVDEYDRPEEQALLADSVGLAMLVVLETLSPAERLAFVLHDMFGVPFEEIAPLVDRSPAATRQLASRARRRVRGSAPVPDPDLGRQREVVAAFLAAARAGDFEGLLATLDPDVVFRADVGPLIDSAPALVSGAIGVARLTSTQGPLFAPRCRHAVVNGAAGVVVASGGRAFGVVGMTIVGGLITQINLILDPDKLRSVVVDD